MSLDVPTSSNVEDLIKHTEEFKQQILSYDTPGGKIHFAIGFGIANSIMVEGEDSNLYDVLNSGESPNPDKTLLHESLRTEIERALETLTPREADVVRLYFGLANQHAMTLEEIGETFDLTRERVRQIKEKAIRRLKHTSRSKILKTYLG